MAFGYDAALIVTKDKMVYGLGNNYSNQLGIGNISNTLQPKKIDVLCGKNIKTFCCNNWMASIFALTEEGEIYSWGLNGAYGLGIQRLPELGIVYTPTRITSLNKECIVDIACSNDHSLALTKNGKMYTWGDNKYSKVFCNEHVNIVNLPWQVQCKEKFAHVACGLYFNMAITNNGKIYSWGINDYGQLGIGHCQEKKNPCIITSLEDITIVKVVCGSAHTLALTTNGLIYSWGKNNAEQLGHDSKTEKEVIPTMLKIPKMGKVLNVAARHDGSLAIDENGCVYIWGHCFNEKITIPIATAFSNIYDVYLYNIPYIIQEPLINPTGEKPNILKCLERVFDDQSTSDFTIIVEEQPIYVHKVILNVRCQHFRNMFNYNWIIKDNHLSSRSIVKSAVLVHNRFSYNVYKAFLKYLYTDIIDLSLDEILELMELADEYNEKNLKRDCIEWVKKEITIANVASFYYNTIKYDAEELEEFCYQFTQDHMINVEQTENCIRLDENVEHDIKIEED
ncbi:RCC1 and BTB domain-containing protein 1-like isoform X2 [Camponotus japonicus]